MRYWLCIIGFHMAFLLAAAPATALEAAVPILSCAAGNDLHQVLKANGLDWPRVASARKVVEMAKPGGAVLILADGYPARTTVVDADLFAAAAKKGLRVYIEYPSFLPGMATAPPRATRLERAVVASDVFGPNLARLRILGIHDCHFVPVAAPSAHIVAAKVAGFDTAVYGLPAETAPILFELPPAGDHGDVLVSTTALSRFVTGRYAPSDAWRAVWQMILGWARPGEPPLTLKWTPAVRPSYGRDDQLPADAERVALRRGIEWYFAAHMIVHESMLPTYNLPSNRAEPTSEWPYGHRIATRPADGGPVADGRQGVLEGFGSRILHDGTQPVLWWRRSDCNAEIAGTLALTGRLMNHRGYLNTAGNIADWLCFRSVISQGDRANPKHPAYGLMGWNDVPQYWDKLDGYGVYYGDDNARTILGMILAGAALRDDRFEERLMKCLLANLRLTSQRGFQPDRVDQPDLERQGWRKYFESDAVSLSPHYQSYMWACYLWAYQQTGIKLFLKRTQAGIGEMMKAGPDGWTWSSGVQLERAKLLLPLAWLVRIEDTPEHRAWLETTARDLLAAQDKCGAIRELLAPAGKAKMRPPTSNDEYGTAESSIIQTDSDAACDLLYTANFALLGLHEAAAATGDKFYREAEDRLVAFLCRAQIRSETRPELDGGWFRAFDIKRWDYWASNADAGWGAWCIESGWSQSWITIVLGLRQTRTSLWDITANSQIRQPGERLYKTMIPDK